MPFEEKLIWVNLVAMVAVPATYFSIMLERLGEVSAAEISFQWPLIIAIGVSIGLEIAGSIVTAIGTSISAELHGRPATEDIERKDERDVHISRHGELVGMYVSSAGMAGVLVLTMMEADYFWIASALYLSFAVGTLVGSVVKLVSYHRGF